MGATRKPLFSISYVTDHDCGNYHVGEIDWGIHGTLRQYLKQYGKEGKNDIVSTLSFLICEVVRESNMIEQGDNWPYQAETPERKD